MLTCYFINSRYVLESELSAWLHAWLPFLRGCRRKRGSCQKIVFNTRVRKWFYPRVLFSPLLRTGASVQTRIKSLYRTCIKNSYFCTNLASSDCFGWRNIYFKYSYCPFACKFFFFLSACRWGKSDKIF